MAVTTRSGALFRDTITLDHGRADIVLGDAYVDITQASALYSIGTDAAPQLTAALLPDVVTAPVNAAGAATIPDDIINELQPQAGGTRGQLFFGTDGLLVDKRIAYFNEGTTGPEFRIIDNASGNNLRGFSVENMVVDSAAGFYYAIVSDGTGGQGAFLIRGAISGGPATVLADYATALGASNLDPLVLSLAIDPVNSRLYVGIQENTGVLSPQTQAGIRQYTYNGSTGAVTDNGFLVTAQSSGKPAEGGFTFFDPNDIEINSVTNTLFFTEFGPGVPSVGLFRLSLSSPNTIVQVVSQAQFPDSGANGFIYDVEADSSTNITYFTTFSRRPSPDPAYNAAQNQIWYVTNASTATNATAVELSLFDTNGTTNFRTVNTVFYPTSLIFDQSTRQLYVASEQLGGTNDDRIYVFQLNAAGTQGTLVNTIFPSFGSSSVNLTALAFNSLPTFSTFSGNAVAALEQGSAIVATAAGSAIADDGRLNAATVQITGGTFTSTEAGVNNDNLAVGAGLQGSGLVAGTNITVSYTAGTRTLSLSGYDTLANYQSVLSSVRYYSTGNNPTNYGANTTRTITWTLNDGAINLLPNSLATTTTTISVTGINDAPTASGLQGDSVTTTEPAGAGSVLPAVKIDSGQNATLADLDNLNFNGGSIRFAITAGLVSPQDRLNIDTAAATTVTVAGATVSVGGTAIGTFTGGGAGGADLVVTLNASATPALVQTLIRAIDFANTGGDNPTAGARTITTTLIDGSGTANGGADTLTVTSTVNVVATNDAPTITGSPASNTFTPGVAGNVDLSPTSFADPDSTTLTATITAGAQGTFTTATVAGVTVGGSGTTLTLTGTASALNSYLDTVTNVRFTPTAALNGSFSFAINVSDGSASSGGLSTSSTITFTPNSLAAFGTAVTQDFNLLTSSSGSGLTPVGWTFSETGVFSNTFLATNDGSDGSGNTYSFGVLLNVDRAFGGLRDGNVVPTVGGAFTNNTSGTITSLVVSYTGEQWRLGATGRTDRLDFQYSTNATNLTTGSWTDVDALDFNAPQSTGTVGALNGNAAANRTAITFEITGLNIAAGTTFWFRWNDFDATGADDGLGIDDFSITARSITAGNDTGTVLENGTILNGNLFANDAALGGTLAVGAVNGVAGNVGTQITLASGALVTVRANGTYDYNPNGRFNTLIDVTTAAATGASNTSATDSFSYTLNGGSTATVTVTINGVAGTGDQLRGDAGNNTINGTPLDDFFDLSQGGNDTINGGNGNDAFLFGAAFTAADTVDGGVGTNDQIGLQGNYSGANALTLGATTITNVEVIAVLPGFSYSITTVDANIAAGQNLTFFGTSLGAGDNFTVNASAETNGTVRIYGGLGTDTFTGGAGDDGFYFGPGRFNPATDTVNGGAGTNDQVALDGNYTATISGTQLQNVEVLVLLRGVTGDLANYNITLADDLIGTGQTFTVFGLAVETGFTLNATAETNGNVSVFGGSGADTISTGAGADRIFGGGGADILNGGAGADTFVYDAVSQSTGATYDRITGFVSGSDKLDFNFTVTGVDATVGAGTLSTASFDANLAAVIGAGQLLANHAVLFQASAGTLAGQTFLVVDANGVAGYQAGADYVIQLVTPPASLVTGDFI